MLFCLSVLLFLVSITQATFNTLTPRNDHFNPKPSVDLVPRHKYHGRGTWYMPGLGACGSYSTSTDYIVAINKSQYRGRMCREHVHIINTTNGKAVHAQIQDKCPGCSYGSLDMSPAVFTAIADSGLGEGILQISWSFSGAHPHARPPYTHPHSHHSPSEPYHHSHSSHSPAEPYHPHSSHSSFGPYHRPHPHPHFHSYPHSHSYHYSHSHYYSHHYHPHYYSHPHHYSHSHHYAHPHHYSHSKPHSHPYTHIHKYKHIQKHSEDPQTPHDQWDSQATDIDIITSTASALLADSGLEQIGL